MAGGKGKIKPEDGKQFSSEHQPQEKWTEKKAIKLGNDLIEWMLAKDSKGVHKANFFYEEFIVMERGHYPSLISYLSSKFSSFSKLMAKAKKIQELKLVKYGVASKLNPTMTKFTLINNHNWKDKVETEISGKDGEEIKVQWYLPKPTNINGDN